MTFFSANVARSKGHHKKRGGGGREAEIRYSLKAEGDFKDTRYTIRYFQPDGKGEHPLIDRNNRYMTGKYEEIVVSLLKK